jgi:hypothetical protein
MFLDPVPQDEEKEPLWQRILAIATYLFFWLLFTAVGLWLMFEIRSVIVELMILAKFNPWMVRGWDRWAIYMLGLAWFVGLMWIDHYLRTAIGKKRLWRNIGRVATIETIMVAVVFGLGLLIRRF